MEGRDLCMLEWRVRVGVAGCRKVSRKERELGEQGRGRRLGTLRPDVTAREAGAARVSSHEPTLAAVTAATADAERRGCTQRTNECAGKDTASGGVGVEWRGGVARGPSWSVQVEWPG